MTPLLDAALPDRLANPIQVFVEQMQGLSLTGFRRLS